MNGGVAGLPASIHTPIHVYIYIHKSVRGTFLNYETSLGGDPEGVKTLASDSTFGTS